MTKSRNIIRPKKQWQPIEDVLLMACYPFSTATALAKALDTSHSAVYQRSRKLGLSKSDWFKQSSLSSRLLRGGNVGAETRFQKGQTSWNKGVSYQPGGACKDTQFKKGTVPPNYKPVGTIRTVEGYQEVKVAEGMRQWKQLHRVVWERCNGPIPKGMCLIFRDGNKQNISLANLELVTREQNMKRNSYHENYPKEIQLAIQLRGALTRQINRRTNHE